MDPLIFHEGPQLAAVGIEGLTTCLGQAAESAGYLAAIRLLNANIPGFFEPGKMGGEIALGQACLQQQIVEVSIFDCGKDSQNKGSGRLMDRPVQS